MVLMMIALGHGLYHGDFTFHKFFEDNIYERSARVVRRFRRVEVHEVEDWDMRRVEIRLIYAEERG